MAEAEKSKLGWIPNLTRLVWFLSNSLFLLCPLHVSTFTETPLSISNIHTHTQNVLIFHQSAELSSALSDQMLEGDYDWCDRGDGKGNKEYL
jgi:hypothetical protein